MDEHTLFDLTLRSHYAGQVGPYSFKPELDGSCAGVEGPSGSAARVPFYLPDWSSYSNDINLTGVKAIVQPHRSQHTLVSGTTIPNLPSYVLDTRDPHHWCWVPLMKPAPAEVQGDIHCVAMRHGYSPSDPTIEQFDPDHGPWQLFLVSPPPEAQASVH